MSVRSGEVGRQRGNQRLVTQVRGVEGVARLRVSDNCEVDPALDQHFQQRRAQLLAVLFQVDVRELVAQPTGHPGQDVVGRCSEEPDRDPARATALDLLLA